MVATSQLFAAHDTVFSTNSQWGLEVSATVTLNSCIVSENQQGGVRIVGAQEGDINSVGSTLTNNGEYGVLFEDCQVTMDQSELAGLSISGSRYILVGSNLLERHDIAVPGCNVLYHKWD